MEQTGFSFSKIKYVNLTDNASSRESCFLLEKKKNKLLLNIIRMQYIIFLKRKIFVFFSFQALLVQECFGVLYPGLF